MWPTDSRSRESGLTLIEVLVVMTITCVLVMGGYRMLTHSQKYLAYKELDKTAKTEINELIAIVKKDWDFRVRKDTQPPGVPDDGFSLLKADNTACPINTPCTKLRVWILRNVNNSIILDQVTVENVCRLPSKAEAVAAISALDYSGDKLDSCSSCPKGQIPAVKIEGINLATGQALLAAENRIFPKNVADLNKVNTSTMLGMQACFSQTDSKSPLSMDVRALYRDQSSKSLNTVQKTQVFPFENFAQIRLEQ